MRCPIIVGRDEPVSLMGVAVRRLRADARGGTLVVVGEAGVGKTRLAEHMQEQAARAGVVAVTGRALPEAGGSPLRPFAEALLELTRGRPAPEEAGRLLTPPCWRRWCPTGGRLAGRSLASRR